MAKRKQPAEPEQVEMEPIEAAEPEPVEEPAIVAGDPLEEAVRDTETLTLDQEIASLGDLQESIASLIDTPISVMGAKDLPMIWSAVVDAARFAETRGLPRLATRLRERSAEISKQIRVDYEARVKSAEPQHWRVTRSARFIVAGQITELREGSVVCERTHDMAQVRAENIPLEPYDPPKPQAPNPVLSQERGYVVPASTGARKIETFAMEQSKDVKDEGWT